MVQDVHKFLRGEIMHPDAPYFIHQIVRTPEDGTAYPDGGGYGMPHSEFERYHTLIQWMFPTMTGSDCQPHSPVLTWEDVVCIRTDAAAQDKLVRADQYMRRFYSGDVGNPLVLSHRDHNHLRVTRIIQSLSLLHSVELAQEFLSHISRMNSAASYPVNMASVEFWNKAKFYGADMKAKQH